MQILSNYMKYIVYEIRGCSGSFREVPFAEHTTLAEAEYHANRKNQDIADRRGMDLEEYLNDRSNYEGSYGAKEIAD